MRGTARLGDRTQGSCSEHGSNIGGTIITCSENCHVNNRGVARLADTVLADCGHQAIIITACATVQANNRGVARLNDQVQGSEYSGIIVTASADTMSE